MPDASEFYADPEDVRRLLEREDYPEEVIEPDQLEGFHDDAHMVVDEELSDSDMSDTRLAKIEARLAGHYILDSGVDSFRQADRMQESDGALRWFGDTDATGLTGTTLGKQALELDTTGRLRDLLVDEPRGTVKRSADRHVRSAMNPPGATTDDDTDDTDDE